MGKGNATLKLRGIRFNLLAKNLASGVAVLLTPGLIFLVSMTVLLRLYFQVENGSKVQVAWVPIIAALVLALIVGGVCAWLLVRFISRTVVLGAHSSRQTAQAMAEGDFTLAAWGVTNDELADLANVLNETRETVSELLKDTREVYREVAVCEDSLSQTVLKLRDSGQKVDAKVDVVTPVSLELNETAVALVASSRQISQARTDIETHAQQALSIGVAEIAELSEITGIIEQFETQSGEIAAAVVQIANIAENTSLLALNATIESAKAGEVGAGFAVVAGQIKELAVQTAESAAAVTKASEEIQNKCEKAVAATAQVSEKLNAINTAQSDSATAVANQAQVVATMESTCDTAVTQTAAIRDEIETIGNATQKAEKSLQQIETEAVKARDLIGSIQELVGSLRLEGDS